MFKIQKTQETQNGMKKITSINASFNQLVEILGETNVKNGDDKTSNEWNLMFIDTDLDEENICCIYDFKQGCYENDEIIEWNIGSCDFCAAVELKVVLSEKLNNSLV